MRQGSERLVLCYHAVSAAWPVDIAVAPDQFALQLRHLVEHGYQGTTFSELVLGEASGKAVAVTFDDGFASVSKVARPIMDRFGLPGTVFVPTELVNEGRASSPSLPNPKHESPPDETERMTWDQVRALSKSGWEVGSHTKTHQALTGLDATQLDEELAGSRLKCEEMIGPPCRSLAYPYGDYDARVIAAAERAGYSAAASAQPGLEIRSAFSCPRVTILRLDDLRLFRLKISLAVRRLPALTSWAQALGLRRAQRLFSGRAA